MTKNSLKYLIGVMMRKSPFVAGNPVLAEDIEKAKILHDDVVKEVVQNFKDRKLVKRTYVTYVIEALRRTNKYEDLREALTSLVQDSSAVMVKYAHDADIESLRLSDLHITHEGADVGWEEIFSRCVEAIQGNENITKVEWPSLPLLIFETLFQGERLNYRFAGLNLDQLEEAFLVEFNDIYSRLRGKFVNFQHRDEESRHTNRKMYAWADKNAVSLTSMGIPYVEDIQIVDEAFMTTYMESIFGNKYAEERVAYANNCEYFLHENTLYQRGLPVTPLDETTTWITEVCQGIETKEEAMKHLNDEPVNDKLLHEKWDNLSVSDRTYIRENKKLTGDNWKTFKNGEKQIIAEILSRR